MATQTLNVRSIFDRAVEITSETGRSAYLDEVCAEEPEIRRQVDDLLNAYANAGSFLERPAIAGDATIHHEPPISERPGTVIGPYKLLQQIGEGGMGVVFMAEQSEPIQRTVALKIIKPGMDTRQVIARFEAERQALAMMDHPNIARVLDAGTTDTGRPYFVMELVKGVPITKYCDDKHLPLRARLELLLPVCQAVQHAHQKGVIHRDIKPTNVLVAEYDEHAVPKVIDFGVAKATAQKLTDRTMFTEFGQVLGTVEYMSPEQAKFNQLDIDTRSDIYSLGVLLYELLTGSTPFGRQRLQSAAFDEALRIIREEEPQKPSTRLSTTDQLPSIAANRHSEPARLSKDVRGELDWVVMKALEKDRNRRYETANDLAADVQRYLHDEAVQACSPSATYRFRKFALRNKAALVTAAIVAVSLVLGTAVSIWQATLARRAEAVAQTRLESEQEARQQVTAEATKAKTISTMLQQMLGSANPNAAKGRDYTVRQMLDDFSEGLKDKLRDQPEAEADIHRTIGNAYSGLGSFDKSEIYLKSALELRVQLFGPEHADVAESLIDYSWHLHDRGDYVGAETRAREALAIYRKLGLQNNKTVGALAAIQGYLAWQRKYQEAEKFAHESLEMARQYPEQNLDVAGVLQCLAFAATSQGDLIKAERFARQAVELQRKRDGDGPATRHGLIFLADSLFCQQKFDEAEACFREVIAIHRKHFDDSQPPVVGWLGLAETLRGKGDRAGLDALRATIDLSSANAANARDWNFRGRLFLALGEWEQAENAFVNGSEQEASPGEQLVCLNLLALVRLARNDEPGYRETCKSLVKQAETSSEPGSAYTAAMACVLAPDSSGDAGQVAVLAQRAYESDTQDPRHVATLGAALYRAGRFDEAGKRFAEAIEAIPIGSTELHAVTYSHLFLAMVHERLGQSAEARKWLDQAVQAIDKPTSLGQRRLAETWHKNVQLQVLRKEAEAVLADGKGNGATTTVVAPD